MTRRKADPRIERIIRDLNLQPDDNDAVWLRRRLRAFERAVLREAADRACEAVIRPWPPRGAVATQQRVRRAIEQRREGRKP